MIIQLVSALAIALVLAVAGLGQGPLSDWIASLPGKALQLAARRWRHRALQEHTTGLPDWLVRRFPDVIVHATWAVPPEGLRPADLLRTYDIRPFGISSSATLNDLERESHTGLHVALRPFATGILRAKAAVIALNAGDAPFFNGPVVRLTKWSSLRDPVSGRSRLFIAMQPTSYFSFVCTNEALESTDVNTMAVESTNAAGAPTRRLEDLRQQLRIAFGRMGSRTDALANNLAVNINVITGDHKLIYVVRSDAVARRPHLYSSAVSGDMSPGPWHESNPMDGGDSDKDGPNPFFPAVREAREELNLVSSTDQITFLALCRYGQSRQPFLVGQLETDLNMADIVRRGPNARDRYERRNILFIDLTQDLVAIVNQLRSDSELWGRASLLGIYLSLGRRFGFDRIERVFNE